MAPLAHLLDIAVREDLRGRGLGRRCCRRRWRRLSRRRREDDAGGPAIERAGAALYERAGFELVGVRRGYYRDTGEDGLLLDTGRLDEGPGRATRASSARAAEQRPSRPLDDAGAVAPRSSSWRSRPPATRPPRRSCGTGDELLSSVVASQVDFHARFGGVVPEIASRKHTEALVAVVDEALAEAGVGFGDLSALAVTHGPGLVGALVVGLAYAKGLSFATGLPLVGVNHLEAHIFAALLADPRREPPLVALVVSGGHTSLVHMRDVGRVPHARRHARRRDGGGVRQGREVARPRAIPGDRCSRGSRRPATRRRSRSRAR